MNRTAARYLFPLFTIIIVLLFIGFPDFGLKAEDTPTTVTIMDLVGQVRSASTAPQQEGPETFTVARIPDGQQSGRAPSAAQDEMTFTATADATVSEGYPTLDLGNTADMLAGYDPSYSDDAKTLYALVRFNIGGLPSGVTIKKATLNLRLITSADVPDRSKTITTYRVTGDWTESVNWNSKPGYAESYDSQSIKHDGTWPWIEFDVTGLAQKWYDGSAMNYGILLRSPDASIANPGWRGFGTSETDFKPELVVEYETEDGTSTATATTTTTTTPTETTTTTTTPTATATTSTTATATATATATVPSSGEDKHAYLPYISKPKVLPPTATPTPTATNTPVGSQPTHTPTATTGAPTKTKFYVNGKELKSSPPTGGFVQYYLARPGSGAVSSQTFIGTLNGDIEGDEYEFSILFASASTSTFRAKLFVAGEEVASTEFTASSTTFTRMNKTITGIDPNAGPGDEIKLYVAWTSGANGAMASGPGGLASYIAVP